MQMKCYGPSVEEEIISRGRGKQVLSWKQFRERMMFEVLVRFGHMKCVVHVVYV